MFKTIRKGDASLQYTILPQTDQFFGNGPSPQPPDTQQSIFYKLIIPSIFISICLCSILAISALLIMTKREPEQFNTAVSSQIQYNNMINLNNSQTTIMKNSIDINTDEIYSTNISPETNLIIETTDGSIESKTIQTYTNVVNDIIPKTMDTVTEYTSPDSKSILYDIGLSSSSPDNEKSFDNSDIPITIVPSMTIDTSLHSTSSNPKTTVLNDIITNAMSPTTIFKRAKMPRVTLKLRENDTIPQMYMKAGIASYKKGNITTSVLAHGLSLEGLIFKTPEGTIKPWNKKCTFTDSALYTRLKRYCETGGRLFAFGLSLGAIASMICSIIVFAKFKTSPIKWSNIEEPPLNNTDDNDNSDRSKLLEQETKVINENE